MCVYVCVCVLYSCLAYYSFREAYYYCCCCCCYYYYYYYYYYRYVIVLIFAYMRLFMYSYENMDAIPPQTAETTDSSSNTISLFTR